MLFDEKLITIGADANLQDAVKRMRDYRVDALGVWERGQLTKILTPTDVSRATSDGVDLIDTRVGAYARTAAMTRATGDEAGIIIRRMRRATIRRTTTEDGKAKISLVKVIAPAA